ncbi:MAG TPA: hypothetical protein DCZ13_06270 [Porticoccaceae bacterium]|nr:hypothetical protein [Porticoccaceae bacterium]
MTGWLEAHQDVFTWLAICSALTFVISLAILPFLVARIPENYFLHEKREPAPYKKSHPAIRLTALILKNTLGLTLLMGGFIMLFIPGQGLLTIAMGLLLMDYPGKFQLEQRVAQNPKVLHGLNWLRERANAPPLRVQARADAPTEDK